jgi:hypothetical protein
MTGSPNSPPCSPTPCLKIRHMFDPDVWVLFMLFCNSPMTHNPFIYFCACRLSLLQKIVMG